MKLKQLREAIERNAPGTLGYYIGNPQELVEDIDRSSNEVYEAGRKNGKVEALLSIKADEESARQEGYQAGHAAANEALNKANEELGQQRVIIRDQETRIRELEHNRGTYTEWFSKGYEAATGKALQGCCVIWRGADSVSDLATDLRNMLKREEIELLVSELMKLGQASGAKTYAYEKVEQLRTETAAKLDKLWVMVQEQIHAGRLGSSEKHSDQRIEQLEERIERLEATLRALGSALAART